MSVTSDLAVFITQTNYADLSPEVIKAAIFEVADLAVVGDFRKILPPLIREIRAKHTQECLIKTK